MNRFVVKLLLVLVVLLGIGAAAARPAQTWWAERNRPRFRTLAVSRGGITSVVNSTGTIKPVLSVSVGAFVSGPITRLYADFNDEVHKDQLLAEIDTRLYDANVARDRAAVATRRADVDRVQAQLNRAINDEKRSQGLRADNPAFISDSEMDQYRFAREALEAELKVAEAAVKQAQANLDNSEANLGYTKIVSPVDGIVIDRKIDEGQTLASQFQTPELFIVAPDMRKEMHVFASVDEADIGLIREAQAAGQPVEFTVSAYPGELFHGTIAQIRLSSTTTQNVVTYPVVVSAPNADLKLLPGMTADISFKLEEKPGVVQIPNAALRFYPQREHVREADRGILDGTAMDEDRRKSETPPAAAKAASAASRRRHVWMEDGGLLRAVEVVTGISDYKVTELVSGDLQDGDKLVVGLEPRR